MTFDIRTNEENQYLALTTLYNQQLYIESKLVKEENRDKEYIKVLEERLAMPSDLTIDQYLKDFKQYSKLEYNQKHPEEYFEQKVKDIFEFPGKRIVLKLKTEKFVYLSQEFSTFDKLQEFIALVVTTKKH
ncbi:MAG: hypothetical protein Unbinned1524contig1000_14 [Prokaryotic dsDNA virus sp.]|nr:MAG: hypothetical protein Unbinned1524contig1000_14 [Prokaryotic dsDNA virus sp.]|tara:strand:- start:3923 stop:4315 length:393 start_codon:yes stop_codon:yes gene_type:complete